MKRANPGRRVVEFSAARVQDMQAETKCGPLGRATLSIVGLVAVTLLISACLPPVSFEPEPHPDVLAATNLANQLTTHFRTNFSATSWYGSIIRVRARADTAERRFSVLVETSLYPGGDAVYPAERIRDVVVEWRLGVRRETRWTMQRVTVYGRKDDRPVPIRWWDFIVGPSHRAPPR
jgi:hypothetical protein